jgi:superfamily II DNA/RNA helicase
MGVQLKQLRRGAQVVVGTPGRVMDHLRRGTLKLDALQTVVLDEADEMLRMGFIEDVQWILEHTPETRQVALFSATMPAPIQRVADTYLKDPAEIRIAARTSTVERIEQKTRTGSSCSCAPSCRARISPTAWKPAGTRPLRSTGISRRPSARPRSRA